MMFCRAHKLALGLSIGAAMLLLGCSAILPGSTRGSSQKSADAKPPVATTNSPVGEETPTVLVAGVNLTGGCVLFSAEGNTPESRSLECSVSSDGENRDVIINSPKITVPSRQMTLIATAHQGEMSPRDARAMVLGKQRPLSFQFDVPAARVPDLLSEKVSFSFDSLEFKDGVKHSLAFDLRVQTRTPPLDCTAAGANLKERVLSFAVDRQGILTEVHSMFVTNNLPDVVNSGEVFASTQVPLRLNGSLGPLKNANFKVCALNLVNVTPGSSAAQGSQESLRLTGLSIDSPAQRHVVSFGNNLLYSSVNSAFAATESLRFFRTGKIPSFEEFMATFKGIAALERGEQPWCLMDFQNCLTKSNNALHFRFGESLNEVLAEEFAEAIKKEVMDNKFKVWIFDKYTFQMANVADPSSITLNNTPSQIDGEVGLSMTYVIP